MKKDICAQFLCKDCEDFGRCQYYHSRKEDSYICKYFHLPDKLDKIRAEIEILNPIDYVSMGSYEGHLGANDMKHDVLRIIDKYKAESEG